MFLLVLGTLVLISSVYASSGITTSFAAAAPITKVSSGLVASDPLNKLLSMQQLEHDSYWTFSGDAPQEGAPYNFYENSGGLHIGVQAASPGTFAGFFAKSPNTNFVLARVRVTAPVSSLQQDVYEAGIYVQTADGNVNYVTCTSSTSSGGTIWELVWATGNSQGATNFQTLWSSGTGQPLTEICTLITNGNNYLKLYIDGSLVYSSSSLNLQMPSPFQIYLEPETSYAGSELYASFLNFYLTSGEYLTINNLPSSATHVQLVSPGGRVIASAAKSGSSATIEMGGFTFPVNARIVAKNSRGATVASTSGAVLLYGGDVYSA